MHSHHADVTGEIPTIIPQKKTGHRRWSTTRSITGIAFMALTVVFAAAVMLQPRHGADELPQIALDILRDNWVTALTATLAAWAYDNIVPVVRVKFRILLDAIHAIEANQARMNETVASQRHEIHNLRQAAAKAAAAADQHAIHCTCTQQLITQWTDYAVDEYMRGFTNGIDYAETHPPNPAPGPDSNVYHLAGARRSGH